MTDLFLRSLCSINRNDTPTMVWTYAKYAFLDYLSVTLAGASVFRDKELLYLKSLSCENGVASVFGLHQRSSLQTAALLNGMNAHVLELDDGHRSGAVHVGATIFSALLPVAEREGLSMEDVLWGAIIGYETTVRLARAIQPGNKLRGFHATGTCGTLGATMAIAAALNFDFNQMKSALSAAVSSASGVLEMQEDNADLKPFNVGHAAMDAVAAAYIGKSGFIPPCDALGGKRGFLSVMTDVPKVDVLTSFDQREPLAITQVYRKIYASCRHTHPAIDAAIALKNEYGLAVSDVDSVRVETYRLAVAGHDHTEVKGVSSAKMSMPFSVAVALHRSRAGVSDFCQETVSDQSILDLSKRVTIVENKELSALVPQKRAAILTIKTNGGTTFYKRVDYPKGEPENPLSDAEMNEKFISLCNLSGIDNNLCERVIRSVQEEDGDIHNLLLMLES